MTTALPQQPARAWYQYRQWWLITTLLVLVSLALALLYWRARRQMQPLEAMPASAEIAPRIDSEAQAYQQLRTACGSQDVRKSYDALQNWCRQYWDLGIVPAFEQLSSAGASERLVTHALELQQRLYGQQQESETPWDSAELLQAVVEQRHHQRKASTEQQGLPPLYPE